MIDECKCTDNVQQLYDCRDCSISCGNCSCCQKKDTCNYCVNPQSIEFAGLCDPQVKFAGYDNNIWRNLIVEGALAVPSEKPSIEEVIKISSSVEIIRTRVINTPIASTNVEGLSITGKKLIVEGLVCMTVSYVSLTPEQSVHSFHGQVPFSTFIVVPLDFQEDFDLLADYCIESIDVKRVCQRTVDLCVCVFVAFTPVGTTCNGEQVNSCNGYSLQCINNNQQAADCCPQPACGFQPNIIGEVDQETLAAIDPGTMWTEIAVPEILNIPEAKPDIYQLLSVNSRMEMVCQRIIATPVMADPNEEGTNLTGVKIIINGMLKQRITYVADCACGAVHAAHFDVPISAYIVAPAGTSMTAKFRIETFIEDIFACAMNERQVFKNTTLFIQATEIEPCIVEEA